MDSIAHRQLASFLRESESHVKSAVDGNFSIGQRFRLWALFESTFSDDAWFRKVLLGLVVANGLLPRWRCDAVVHDDPRLRFFPQYCLHICRDRLLRGGVDIEQLKERYNIAMPALDQAACLKESAPGICVETTAIPFAAAAAAGESLQGPPIYAPVELFDATEAEFDFEDWDVHAYVAFEVADLGRVEEGARLNRLPVEVRRDFWLRWLAVDVPLVLEPMPRLRQLLDSIHLDEFEQICAAMHDRDPRF